MKLLDEACSAMEQYCSNLVVVLEQALEAYCYAETGQGKETAMNTIKKHSAHLVLLEPFYSLESDERHAAQLAKLCILLGQESYQEDNEQMLILTKIFRLIGQLPAAGWR